MNVIVIRIIITKKILKKNLSAKSFDEDTGGNLFFIFYVFYLCLISVNEARVFYKYLI